MILPKLLGCQKQNCQYIIVYKVLYGKCEGYLACHTGTGLEKNENFSLPKVLVARGTFELGQSLVYSFNLLMYPVSWDTQTLILDAQTPSERVHLGRVQTWCLGV